MADTEITIEPSNLAFIDDISIPTIGDGSDTNTAGYTGLADVIKHALLNIKTGQHKNFRPQRHERKHKFPFPICAKNCNEKQQSIYCSQCINRVHRKCNGTSKLNLTSYLMNLMMYHFTVFYALFIIMQRFIHLVIYQHLKC